MRSDQPQPLELAFNLVQESVLLDSAGELRLEALAEYVLRQERAQDVWEVTVSIVSDDRLQQLHRDFMGIDAPTDVMTFPFDDPGGDAFGGDIVISADHAAMRGAEWGNSPEEEIQFLLAHGILHLAGWTDETEDDRQLMLRRQQELIDLFSQR